MRLAFVETLGSKGVLTTARMRDLGEAPGSPLALYPRGEAPLVGSAEAMPVATGITIALDGATVLPGDFVHASARGRGHHPPGRRGALP
jgi:regulator of RNase E activity RraA